MSMLVSHETPNAYLEMSRRYNDYDYCLVHLCDTYPEYLQFFKDSLSQGREVLLDNSIFELGTAYDPVKFASRIQEIKPTYYVVPDVLEDCYATMNSWEAFDGEFGDNLPGLAIGVVQGKTFEELVNCYKFMSKHADYIAISFDYSYYQITGLGDTKLEKMMDGRIQFIDRLIREGIWNGRKPHHLLGCSLAREFKMYQNTPSIRSCDTSNPVTAALDGARYLEGIGLLNTKPAVKLADQIEAEYDNDTAFLIMDNTQEFKNLIHG